MPPPWTAEREVPASLARTLIASQFPELSPARIEPFGVGWDNTAYLVDGQFVFRFPRRQLGADCMAAELAVLPHLAARLPLPIPDPVFAGRPAEGYPWPFAGYRRLAGRTACAALLDDHGRARLAEPLARFLAALHATPAAQARAWGAGPDTFGRLDLQKRVPMAREYLDRVKQLGLVQDIQPLVAVVDDIARRSQAAPAAGDPASPRKSQARPVVLVHGDLYVRHLLVDEVGDLCGVIDWGDVHLGRPAVDLSIAHTFLPPAAHQAFRTTYGHISEEDWRLARFRAVYHSAIVVTYGHEAGDEVLLRAGRTSLRYLASG
jgi:aminoglycoside phosphotransferase (APT) family kinase protein